jgi:hypothetical protein
MRQWQLPEALEHPMRFHHDPDACAHHVGQARVAYLANRLAHRYGFRCAADSADLFDDAICTKAGLNEPWLGDLDRRVPGLFQEQGKYSRNSKLLTQNSNNVRAGRARARCSRSGIARAEPGRCLSFAFCVLSYVH